MYTSGTLSYDSILEKTFSLHSAKTNPENIYVLSIWKTPVTRTIGRINFKWRRKSVVSGFLIWSAASYHIACRATRKFRTRPHLCSIWPHSHAILYCYCTLQPGQLSENSGALSWREWEGCKSKVIGSETEATCAEAPMQLLIADCWCYFLECALFKHEYAHCWYIPDDGLHEDVLQEAPPTLLYLLIIVIIIPMSWQCFHFHIWLNLIFACSEDNKALRIKNAWGIYTSRVSLLQIHLNIFRYTSDLKSMCAAYPLVVLHLWNQRSKWSLSYTASKVSLITPVVTRQSGLVDGTVCL